MQFAHLGLHTDHHMNSMSSDVLKVHAETDTILSYCLFGSPVELEALVNYKCIVYNEDTLRYIYAKLK